MAALLTFPVIDIKVDGVAVDLPLPSQWIGDTLSDSDISAAQDGRIRGRLSRSGPHDIVVRTRVEAQLSVPCVRCLEPADIAVDADLSLLLLPATRPDVRRRETNPEYEFNASEADHDVYDGETVVLDHFVREALLLEVPSFPLCRDDCPGIQPDSLPEMAPAEGDPRLAPLSAFRDKEDGPVTVDDLVTAARERSAQLRGRRTVLKSSHQGSKSSKRRK